jgi:hypothetical protein
LHSIPILLKTRYPLLRALLIYSKYVAVLTIGLYFNARIKYKLLYSYNFKL